MSEAVESRPPWHEDDAFWDAAEPFLFSPERIAKAVPEVEAALVLAAPAPGARILDLGTGPARHAIELARRGFRVTGVDRNPRYLARAAREARAAGVDAGLELVTEDMRRFVRPGGFDAAINLFTTFGYFGDDENLAVARNLRASLVPGGVALFDLHGKEVLAARFQPRDWVEFEGGFLLEERAVSPDWARIENRWILVTGGRTLETHLSIRQYSGLEFRALLLEAGFAHVALHGGLDGSPYDRAAKRLVAVARVAGP